MSLLFSLAATTTKRGRFGRNYGRSRYQKYAVTIARSQMADPIGLIQSPILAGLQRCLITFLTAITFALSAIGSTFADGSGMPNESCPQSSLCERPHLIHVAIAVSAPAVADHIHVGATPDI